MMKKLKQKLKSSREKNEEKLFLENEGFFLEQLIADCNGKFISIQKFSSSQILKATNNFDYSYLVKLSLLHGKWYKGIIDNKPYLIKKFNSDIDVEDAYNDIILSARMSNHNNFLKLIGCCFEFFLPVIVFEYEELATLNYNGRIMVNWKEYIFPWSVRLKIAKEFAIAVTYLHIAFSRIIIHRSISSENIFLDKNGKVKLIDFTFSVSLPEGKTRITDAKTGVAFCYIDPLSRYSLSEYTDVYNFGLCLLVFLIGKSSKSIKGYNQDIIHYAQDLYKNGKLDKVIDPEIAKDITSDQRLQVEAYLVLAFRCCKEERKEDRPKMIQVSKELKRIERIKQPLNATKA